MKSWGTNLNSKNDEPEPAERHHHPSEDEVLCVQRSLTIFVPAELADLIIEHAQYWPRLLSIRKTDPPMTIGASIIYKSDVALTYITTEPPIPGSHDSNPRVTRKVRKVVFKILSHDVCSNGNFPRRGAAGLTGLDFNALGGTHCILRRLF